MTVSTAVMFNPLVTNELSHPYHLDESTFILGASGVIFHFYSNFGRKACKQSE